MVGSGYSNTYRSYDTWTTTITIDDASTATPCYYDHQPSYYSYREVPKSKSWPEITNDFWEGLHNILPKPVPEKLGWLYKDHLSFNPKAFTRRMNFSKAGKIPKSARMRNKCRKN